MERFLTRTLCLGACVMLVIGMFSEVLAFAGENALDVLEKQAYEAWSDEDFQKAVQVCTKAMEQDPHVAWPYELLGERKNQQADYKGACEILTQGIEAGAESPAMFYERMVALEHQKYSEEAWADFRKAVELEYAEDQACEYVLGWQIFFYDDENYTKIRRLCEEQIKSDPAVAWAHALLDEIEQLEERSQGGDSYEDEVENAFEDGGISDGAPCTENLLPPGVGKALSESRWAGYDVVASACNYEIEQPREVFAVIRKGEHNVLCLLEWSKAQNGYTLTWANEKAVYQGDYTPRMYFDGHMDGMLRYQYVSEEPTKSRYGMKDFEYLNAEEYMFLCDEESGAWRFEHMALNHAASQDQYADIAALTMETNEDGGLTMLWQLYEWNGSYLDEMDPVARMTYDAGVYVPALFDIERCNEDFAALAQQAQLGSDAPPKHEMR